MSSKNKIKFFNSLKLRKFRIKHNLFLAEGEKIILELLRSEIKPRFIITSKENFPVRPENFELLKADYSVLKKISALKTAPEVIGVFEIPKTAFKFNEIKNRLNLFCEDIQNPGNLGTIIRTADWFGIRYVFCSQNTADVYNPKVVQATMGAIASVKVIYVNKIDFFSKLPEDMLIYGTFTEGENIYETELSKKGIVVIGNEGKGISEDIKPYITNKLSIPSFSANKNTESLNASVAAAIVCSEFMRK